MDNNEKNKIKKRVRNKIIRAWLSEDEYKLLLDKCEHCNMSISAYMRDVIVNSVIIHYEPFAIKDVLTEINRIGNNINQIAKKVNERGSVIEMDNEDLRNQYEQLFNMVLDKIMGVK